MSLTRRFLKGMELSEEQIDSIIGEHSNTVSALKEQMEEYKEKAEKLVEVQKALDKANKQIESDDSKEKLEELQKEFDNYKAETEAREEKSAKEAARIKILKDAGIPDNWIERAKNSISLDKLEIVDGELKDSESHIKAIKEDWADVIGKIEEKGADTSKPPVNSGAKVTMTREEIRKIQNPKERQKAMLENPSLFGLGKGE